MAILVLALPTASFCRDGGRELTNACRSNLEKLNKITATYIENHPNQILPPWSNMDTFITMIVGPEYLERPPETPTAHCGYNLVFLNRQQFDWYCDLHGVLEGDRRLTIPYHEFEIHAFTDSRYETIRNYQEHTRDLLRWTQYRRSPIEMLKYHYNRSPTATIVISSIGLLIFIYVYRQLTA